MLLSYSISNVCPKDIVRLRADFCSLLPMSTLRDEGVWNFQRSQGSEEREVKRLLFCPGEWPAEEGFASRKFRHKIHRSQEAWVILTWNGEGVHRCCMVYLGNNMMI